MALADQLGAFGETIRAIFMLPCAVSAASSRLAFITTGNVRSDSLANTLLRLRPVSEDKHATGKLGSCLRSHLHGSFKYSSRSLNSVTSWDATTQELCGFLLLLPTPWPPYRCSWLRHWQSWCHQKRHVPLLSEPCGRIFATHGCSTRIVPLMRRSGEQLQPSKQNCSGCPSPSAFPGERGPLFGTPVRTMIDTFLNSRMTPVETHEHAGNFREW